MLCSVTNCCCLLNQQVEKHVYTYIRVYISVQRLLCQLKGWVC